MRRNAGTDAAPGNMFTDGDPSEGIAASVVGAEHLNISQEEICNVIEGAGLDVDQSQPESTNDKTQLLQAIQILASAGGGGGAGASWQENPGNSPTNGEENGGIVYFFQQGLDAKLNLFLKVPEGYVAGRPISMKIGHYSPSSANTQLLKTISTLIRKNQDAVDSVTNQQTSSNVALTNTVANQLRLTTLDITDADGEINNVAVAAGDMIKVSLYRDTDTDAADIRFIPSITEVRF